MKYSSNRLHFLALVNRLPLSILLFTLMFFLFTAGSYISLPGLYYDEVLFVNAALGGIDDSFVSKRIWGIPVMLMPYIGALKSYIYFGIFKVFGVSSASVRIPAILISTGTLLVSYAIAKRLFGKWIALVLVVLMATNPSFIFMSKLDFGPVVLMMFFKMLSLLFYFKIVQSRPDAKSIIRDFWFLVMCLSLGLYDKLNFIWFIASMIFVTIIVYRKRIVVLYRTQGRRIIYPFVTLFGIVSAVLFGLIVPLIHSGSNEGVTGFAGRISYIYNIYRLTFDGEAMYSFIFAKPLVSPTWSSWSVFPAFILIGIILMIVPLGYKYKHGSECQETKSIEFFNSHTYPFFFAILFGFIFTEIIITRQAGWAHHIMMLFPFYYLLLISAIFSTIRIIGRRSNQKRLRVQAISWTAACIVFSGLLIVNLKADAAYLIAFQGKESFNPRWDPAIHRLSDFIESKQTIVMNVVSADWGLHTQLFSLAKPMNRKKYLDFWPSFNDWQKMSGAQRQWLYRTYFAEKKVLIATHGSETVVMESTRPNLFLFMSEFNVTVLEKKGFHNRQGRKLYEVYEMICPPLDR